MAGENILPLARPEVSLHYTVPTSTTVKKGDLVKLPDALGFSLEDGSGDNGDVINVCIRCKLVVFSVKRDGQKALAAGSLICIGDNGTISHKDAKSVRSGDIAGFLHDNKAAGAVPAYIIWDGGK